MVSVASPAAGAMPPPPTPTSLLKRPNILKRDSSYLDTDDEAGLSSTTKKFKVSFSPNIDVRYLDDWNEKSFELVKEEVRLGIERHLAPADRRDDTQYFKLLQVLGQDADSEEAPSGKVLKKYIMAIDARASALGECGKLAIAVLELGWLGRDEIFAGLYIKFLTTLATAHSKYIGSIMEKLVAHFTRLPASLGRLSGEMPVSRATMFSRVHAAIKTLLSRVPSAAAALVRALKAEFPNDLATTRSYSQYQKHMLRLADYAPELKAEVLSIIMQRLVSIDIEIQQDIEELEEEAEEKLLQQRPSSKDDQPAPEDSDDSDMDSVSESEETVTEEEQRLRELRLKVAKMDNTMDLLFEYYTPLIQTSPQAGTNEAYQQLLSHFETFILPNRTRHAQFLIFHFSQADPEYTNRFAEQCVQLISEPSLSLTLRLHACAYLASFTARSAHMDPILVRSLFSALLHFMEDMRRRHEPNCRGPDKRAYSLYYAIAQAALYVFCFRWRDLCTGPANADIDDDENMSEDDIIAEGRELSWLQGMREALYKNIHSSSLNPLKVCSPAIVSEFARIAHHLNFMYIYTKIESNKRVRLGNAYAQYTTGGVGRRETAMDRKIGEAHLQLEAYFPFDPYHLPKSKKWIEGEYREWEASIPRGMKREDDEEYDGFTDSDDDDEDDDSSDDEEEPAAADDESVSS